MRENDSLESQSLLLEKTPKRVLNQSGFIKSLTRKKEFVYSEDSGLNRILGLHDLVFLGLSSMLGMGVYILAGELATKIGPAMMLSFIFAGAASTLAALCYAEFASRTPGTGSAYAYCYITIGEFVAFILGWNLCLEFVIGTACLVRGMSAYLDSQFGGSISNWEKKHFGMHFKFLSEYLDILSFIIIVIFSGIVSIGVRESTIINNTFAIINMVTIITLIIIGLVYAKIENWSLSGSLNPHAGQGGFMPFGFSSVMEGAATCFYAYTGFDTIATTGGEAKNPQTTVPLALVLSISLAIVVYGSISATLTLMWPYFDQNLNKGSPYPYIFEKLELKSIKLVVTTGALAAVTGCSYFSTLSSVFGMARIVYSIAQDGLLFQPLSVINRITKTPVYATIVSGLFTGFWSVLFNTEQLIDMTSIGTLMAYTMVAICVLLLRYEDESMETTSSLKKKQDYNSSLRRIFNTPTIYKEPNELTSTTVRYATYIVIMVSVMLGLIFAFGINKLMASEPVICICTVALGIIMIIALAVITRQPESKAELKFKVKPIPYLPALSLFINIYLMLKLNLRTWIRFGAWLILGLLIYFAYGIGHSKERKNHKSIPVKKY
ncbi:high affinity cationic amino acid transporter 1 isoform X1 [Halyomorpha halys]|uniref:high affinity cationic amino acid transporter 1 isoform X1 n=2 Tax=Halyomorpha halys TaxID=286706 RepID=UPI0006D4E313|nr:high affinity cationic amino acid transporter 1-like isoform X3 [Halyomorpha halys]